MEKSAGFKICWEAVFYFLPLSHQVFIQYIMDKRQEYPTPPVGHKPSSYNLPSVIVIYTLVIILGIGLCFCLRKANRLVPNRYSFPLILRSNNDQGNARGRGRRQRQQDPFDDIDDEESRQGLLNDFSDQDDIDEELNDTQHHNDSLATQARTNNYKSHSDAGDSNDGDDDDFGDLQEASSPSSATATKTDNRSNMFVVVDDDDDDSTGGSSRLPQFGNSGKKSD
ncbi:unnamed protein product [Absidia cylindrospora]